MKMPLHLATAALAPLAAWGIQASFEPLNLGLEEWFKSVAFLDGSVQSSKIRNSIGGNRPHANSSSCYLAPCEPRIADMEPGERGCSPQWRKASG